MCGYEFVCVCVCVCMNRCVVSGVKTSYMNFLPLPSPPLPPIFLPFPSSPLSLPSPPSSPSLPFPSSPLSLPSPPLPSSLLPPLHSPSPLSLFVQIVFLGKVVDELFVKVVEVKKIQGNVNIGSMKCLTRELFSFYPLVSTLKFISSSWVVVS